METHSMRGDEPDPHLYRWHQRVPGSLLDDSQALHHILGDGRRSLLRDLVADGYRQTGEPSVKLGPTRNPTELSQATRSVLDRWNAELLTNPYPSERGPFAITVMWKVEVERVGHGAIVSAGRNR